MGAARDGNGGVEPGTDAAGLFARFGVPGGVAVVVAPNREEARTYGIVSIDGHDPVTSSTLFNVGSVAKTISAGAVGSLAANGRLRLDDPLLDWVPEFTFPVRRLRSKITLRDCLAHRLGLAREGFWEWGADESLPLTTLLGRLRHAPMARPYASGYSYTNVGYAAAALAVSRAAGRPFLDYVRHWLSLPEDGGLAGGSRARGRADLSGCHVLRPRPLVVRPNFADNLLGASGLWVSGEFARLWLRLQLDAGSEGARVRLPRRVNRELRLPLQVVPAPERPFGLGNEACTAVHYALGWFVTRYRGHRVLRHTGAEVGSSAHLAIVPDAGVGVFVMANAESPVADVVGLTLIDELLGLSPLPWAERAPTRAAAGRGDAPRLDVRAVHAGPQGLLALSGSYRHAANGPVRIVARDGRLRMRFRDAPRFDGELLPQVGGQFRPRPADPGLRSLMEAPARFDYRPDGSCEFCLPGFGTWRRP